MKLHKIDKLKSILLSSALAISILFTGCSNADQNKIESQTQIKDSISTNTQETNQSNDSSYKESSASKEVPTGSVKATIERVVDGDTMKLKLDESGETVTLRLLLVDTPESVKKGVDPQPYSVEASNFAKETLASGDTVYIEYDEGDKTDKYDRHLGYLWFYSNEDSKWLMFNEELIAEGYARVGYVYSQRRHLEDFNKAQDYAKSNNLNIWSVPGYVTSKGYDVDAYNANKGSSSSNASSADKNSSNIVYANGGSSTSNKYHSSSDAHNMKGAVKMSEDEAKAQGYVPCGLCY